MLTGNFIGLRAIEKFDIAQLLEWRNMPQYRRYFREYRELNMEHQNNWYAETNKPLTNSLMFAIIDIHSNQLLGASGLCYINWVDKNADCSIYIGVDNLYIDDKLAPDAAKTMIEYGFSELGLHRIWAEIYDFDHSKKKLFTDLGFQIEGQHRQTHWTENKWHDSLFYSILNYEWAK